MQPKFKADVLRLVRETDHELVFVDDAKRNRSCLGGAFLAVGLGIVATGLGQSYLEKAIQPGFLFIGTMCAAAGFFLAFWVAELAFHLDSGTYTYRIGLPFSLHRADGALDELKGIAVTPLNGPDWYISLWFHNGETIGIYPTSNEAKTYKAARHIAKVLRVPVLGSDEEETP